MCALKVDLDLVQDRLFAQVRVRDDIAQSYGVSGELPSKEFFDDVVVSMDQYPASDPLNQEDMTDRVVFRSAVRALGSNSRDWRRYLKHQPEICELLHDYDPASTLRDVNAGRLEARTLATLLGGQTGSKDAQRILEWARQLDGSQSGYYARIRALGSAIEQLVVDHGQSPLPTSELMLVLAAYLQQPPARWPGAKYLESPGAPSKLVGMGLPLACEFLRNLHWPGFKPDRHIDRLLTSWVPTEHKDAADSLRRDCHERARELVLLAGRRDSELIRLTTQCLVGNAITPDGNYSRADNLIWLLGHYIQGKRGDPTRDYVRDINVD